MSHSPEPWKAINHPLGVHITDANSNRVNLQDFEGIESLIGRDNLNRAVACVNACAGIPTEVIEKTDFKTILDLSREWLANFKQRLSN